MSGRTITGPQRRYTLFLLVLVFTSSHLDRQIVAILQEPIKQTFMISDTELGLLTGVMFALFYATLGMPMAMWADRHNRRNLIAFSLSLWSAMTALCGMAAQFWQLLLARIGVGVGEAGSNPPSHSIISDLYAPHERATAMSIFALGINLGIMLGFLIGGWVNEWLGWRAAFVIAGMPGLAVASLVRFSMREPPRGHADGVVQSRPAPPFRRVVATMWRSRPIRQLVLANILISFSAYATVAWVPVYLQRVHGLSTGESGTFLALEVGIGGGLGTFVAGYLADRLVRFGEGWRVWVVCWTVAIASPMAVLAFTAKDATSALLWFVGPAMLGGAYVGVNFALLQSLLPIEMRAVGAAINLFLLNIVGLGLGPLMVGWISDLMQSNAGVNSIRYGLLFTVAVTVWGAGHQWFTGRLLEA